MPRELTFVSGGKLPVALGLDLVRVQRFEMICADMIERNCSTQQIMTHFNENEDLTDGEFATLMFCLGYYQGIHGMGDYSR